MLTSQIRACLICIIDLEDLTTYHSNFRLTFRSGLSVALNATQPFTREYKMHSGIVKSTVLVGRSQGFGEEIANSVSHGLACALSVFALVLLVAMQSLEV